MDRVLKTYEQGNSILQIIKDVHLRNTNIDQKTKFLEKYSPEVGKIKKVDKTYLNFVDGLTEKLENSLFLSLVASFEEELGDMIQTSIDELSKHIDEEFKFEKNFQNQQAKFIKDRPRGLGERYSFGIGSLDSRDRESLKELKDKRDYLAHGSFTEAQKISLDYEEAFHVIKTVLLKFSNNCTM